MSDKDFGKWRKRRGQDIYEPTEGHPYVVVLADEAFSATHTGDNPVLLQLVPIPLGSERLALLAAQEVCEQHWREQQTDESAAVKLGVARVPLDWQQQTDTDVEGEPAQLWVATRPDGTSYAVERDDYEEDERDRRYLCQVEGWDLGEPQPTLEAGQALCQWHADTELVWEAIGPCYVALPYHCDPAPDGGWGAWFGDELIDDTADSSDEAQEACQEHRREQHPPPQAEPTEAPPEPAATPGQLPPPQRADWVIPMPLTDEEMIEAFEDGRKLRRKRRRLQAEVTASAERHKNLVARNRELIGNLEDEIEALDESMPEKPVDCFRSYVREGDEIWVRYSNHEGDTLHERRLEQWEQRQLFGEGDPPADKPPPPATEPPPDDDEPEPAPAAPKERVWFERGATTSHCERYSLRKERGLWQPCHGPGVLASGDLPGTAPCPTKLEARELCQRHLDTRHRWPLEWFGKTKLEAGGQYQLTQLGSGMVLAIRVGSLDEPTTELDEHPDEEQAQEACQADADKRRAEG